MQKFFPSSSPKNILVELQRHRAERMRDFLKTRFAGDGKGERKVILDIKLSESGEGSKVREGK